MNAARLADERLEAGKENAFPCKNVCVCEWCVRIEKEMSELGSSTALPPLSYFCLDITIGWYGNILAHADLGIQI